MHTLLVEILKILRMCEVSSLFLDNQQENLSAIIKPVFVLVHLVALHGVLSRTRNLAKGMLMIFMMGQNTFTYPNKGVKCG